MLNSDNTLPNHPTTAPTHPPRQAKDRTLVAKKMSEHVHSEGTTPLLIFPEGRCVCVGAGAAWLPGQYKSAWEEGG